MPAETWEDKTFLSKLKSLEEGTEKLTPQRGIWLIAEIKALVNRENVYRQFLFDHHNQQPLDETWYALFRLLYRTEEVVEKYVERREFEWRNTTAKRK